jgi:hypothetical protein
VTDLDPMASVRRIRKGASPIGNLIGSAAERLQLEVETCNFTEIISEASEGPVEHIQNDAFKAFQLGVFVCIFGSGPLVRRTATKPLACLHRLALGELRVPTGWVAFSGQVRPSVALVSSFHDNSQRAICAMTHLD